MQLRRRLPLLLCLALATPNVLAQSFNIDVGEPSTGPPPTYAAAGLAGHWNSLRCDETTADLGPTAFDDMLVDIHGNATGVGLHQWGGTVSITDPDPSVTGDHALLLEDALVTYSIPIKTCLFFNGLENGTYEVLTYAWLPNHPEVVQRVFIDNTPGNFFAGGTFAGSHQQGVSFTRHIVEVTSGFMGPHIGIPNFGTASTGGALNAMQLRKLSCAGCTLVCAGDGTASGCPCGNTGVAAHGCDSSLGNGGAQLTASGTPSVASDDVRLHVAGLPLLAPVLFFQGTMLISGGAGAAFGDGLRCAGGSVIRLGLKTAVAGEASVGAGIAGDPALSSAGAVPAGGGLRTYQAWYRNSAGFCTPSTFNLSNGMSVPWQP